ncbi:MAG: DNA polymerase III epsilon subunit DnaQ [Phormidesmis priestleyi Ana]|uniref:DNA polymerase III epsilon subunit DnaQ n=1 Tax=Phormidesmis priestleyi Ana TaxID=1666911 RepID=A0A0P8C4A5_9CYAN|nr:MAG: DNA polymerase III epsilon subunit DnaQ [Phormidesmis priestleyi Ana]
MVAHAAKFQGQSALLSRELLTYYRQVSESPLTVVDIETTGALGHNARIIEVSILKASLATGIEHQETHMINPKVKIPEFITAITGITPEMVYPSPPPEKIWPQCLPVLQEDRVFTAHNLDFDYPFIRTEFKRLGIRFYKPPLQKLCTVILSRMLLADLPSRSLPKLIEHFNFDISTSHRAEADTQACWLLAQILLTQIQNEDDDTLLKRFGQQWIRLQDAAKILNCRKEEAQVRLSAAQVEHRLSFKGKNPMYRRWGVEQFYYEQQGQQMSLL